VPGSDNGIYSQPLLPAVLAVGAMAASCPGGSTSTGGIGSGNSGLGLSDARQPETAPGELTGGVPGAGHGNPAGHRNPAGEPPQHPYSHCLKDPVTACELHGPGSC
jgi:hypothetical protein